MEDILRIIGYARVSTTDQNIDLQLDFLNKMNCNEIFQEKVSALSKDRAELKKAITTLATDDIFVVFKLDRLGRSVKDLIQIVEIIKQKGAHLKTSDGIDTSTPYGIFIFHIFSAIAEMELGLIRERTKLGLIAAKIRGRVGGRPKGISMLAMKKARIAEELYLSQDRSIQSICDHLNISKSTLYKYLKIRSVTLKKNKNNKKIY